MTEMMIPVPGGEVWADDTGGDHPPLLLLHPGIGDSRIWDPLMPALTEDNRVIRYDSRGYGGSPEATSGFSLMEDCVAVLDHLGIGRTPIVGCSQGGAIGLSLALNRPERVEALVLLCPGIPGYPEHEPDAQLEADFEQALKDGPDALAEIGLRMWARAGATPDAVEQMRSAVRAWPSYEQFLRLDPPVFDRLSEIAVPTALLVGDLDLPSLVDSNRAAAARIPDCEFLEVPGVDHLPSLRVPELVLKLIADTLFRSRQGQAS